MVKEWCMLEGLVKCKPRRQSQGPVGAWLANLSVCPRLVEAIVVAQQLDPFVQETWGKLGVGEAPHFSVGVDGGMRFDLSLYVSEIDEVKQRLLDEAHGSKYTIHLGSTKMYKDLKRNFWWPGMKREIAEYVAKYPTCQMVKAEHQRHGGTLQPMDIPVWKWEHVTIDFVTGLPKTRRKNDTVWVVVDRLKKSAHFLPMRVNLPLS